MQEMLKNRPDDAHTYLSKNPQIVYTLFQALLLTNLITPEQVSHLVQNAQPMQEKANGRRVMDLNIVSHFAHLLAAAAQPSATAAAPALEDQQKALLQQIMSMTQAQIDALPADQRAQIMQVKAQMSQK